MNDITMKISAAILVLFLTFISVTQSNGQLSEFNEINFISLDPGDEDSPDHKGFVLPRDTALLAKFYKKYKARSLPAYFKNGQLKVGASCGLLLGVCINPNKYDRLIIQLKLKNHKEESQINLDVGNLVSKLNFNVQGNDSVNLMVINLTDTLIKFYKEPKKKDRDCCPEDYTSDTYQQALRKICSLIGIDEGVKVEAVRKEGELKNIEYIISGPGGSSQGFKPNSFTDEVHKIDPRKFLTVIEHGRKSKQVRTIWDEFIHHKSILDSRNEIVIQFKQDKLKEEIMFEGNISLLAELNDNAIEVPPYSVVGEDFTSVGIESLSPYDFALSFISPMYEVYQTTESAEYRTLSREVAHNKSLLLEWLKNERKAQSLKAGLLRHFTGKSVVYLNSAQKAKLRSEYATIIGANNGLDIDPDNDVQAILYQARNGVPKLNNENNAARKASLISYLEEVYDLNTIDDNNSGLDTNMYNGSQDKIIGSDLKDYLVAVGRGDVYDAIKKSTKDHAKAVKRGDSPITVKLYSFKEILQIIRLNNLTANPGADLAIFNLLNTDFVFPIHYAIQKLKRPKEYFEKFLNSDRTTINALLTEIHRDSLFLAHSHEAISTAYDQLVTVKTGFDAIKNDLLDDRQLSQRNRILLENLAGDYATWMKEFFRIMDAIRAFEEGEYIQARKEFLRQTGKTVRNNEYEFTDFWARLLATKAATQLYKKLIIGKIDLSKHTIADNDKLRIFVLWHTEPGNPPQKLPIATFTLRRLGWNLVVTESAMLIDRINDDLAANSPDFTSSNFSPTGGASCLWTFTPGDQVRPWRNDNGVEKGRRKWHPNKGEYRNKLGFLGRLRPSIGINVSYVNFVESKDFEIGAGPIVGLFNNKLFFTYGYNFSAEGLSPWYMGVGFSFSNVFSSVSNAAQTNTN